MIYRKENILNIIELLIKFITENKKKYWKNVSIVD